MSEPVHFKDWDLSHWQYLNGKPQADAVFKQQAEDFVVNEVLGFRPEMDGEHLLLFIEKRQLNTQQVCQHLAKVFGRKLRDIGYAGLKDKQAITRQWFSLQMNRTETPDLSGINTEQITLIESLRHNKKLRVGALQGNQFVIRLRQVSDLEYLQNRLSQLKDQGFPNYFGPQRFGIKGNNLNWANRMASGESIRDKKLKGFALSAVRSYLFNEVVSKRIAKGKFSAAIDGDVFILSGSQSYFSQALDDEIKARLRQRDILISAPLVGAGDAISSESALELETSVLSEHPNWCQLLVDNGLEQERRAITVYPENFQWQNCGDDLIVQFELPAGCFATSVLRECVNLVES